MGFWAGGLNSLHAFIPSIDSGIPTTTATMVDGGPNPEVLHLSTLPPPNVNAWVGKLMARYLTLPCKLLYTQASPRAPSNSAWNTRINGLSTYMGIMEEKLETTIVYWGYNEWG